MLLIGVPMLPGDEDWVVRFRGICVAQYVPSTIGLQGCCAPAGTALPIATAASKAWRITLAADGVIGMKCCPTDCENRDIWSGVLRSGFRNIADLHAWLKRARAGTYRSALGVGPRASCRWIRAVRGDKR